MNQSTTLLTAALLCLLASCDSPLYSTAYDDDTDPQGNVSVAVLTMEQIASAKSRAAVDNAKSRAAVASAASKLQVCVYDANLNRIRQVNQQVGDDGYGTARMRLDDGTYTLMALAHNGDGMATTTDVSKITFYGNRCTDTFVKAQTLTVTGNTATSISAERCVARIRLTPTDALPEGTQQVRIYYTGGSSSLNAVTALGAANSRQTEYRQPSASYYDVYTIPHSSSGNLLSLTISALSASGNELSATSVSNVPVRTGYQTNLTGSIFCGGNNDAGITITINDTPWQEIDHPIQ